MLPKVGTRRCWLAGATCCCSGASRLLSSLCLSPTRSSRPTTRSSSTGSDLGPSRRSGRPFRISTTTDLWFRQLRPRSPMSASRRLPLAPPGPPVAEPGPPVAVWLAARCSSRRCCSASLPICLAGVESGPAPSLVVVVSIISSRWPSRQRSGSQLVDPPSSCSLAPSRLAASSSGTATPVAGRLVVASGCRCCCCCCLTGWLAKSPTGSRATGGAVSRLKLEPLFIWPLLTRAALGQLLVASIRRLRLVLRRRPLGSGKALSGPPHRLAVALVLRGLSRSLLRGRLFVFHLLLLLLLFAQEHDTGPDQTRPSTPIVEPSGGVDDDDGGCACARAVRSNQATTMAASRLEPSPGSAQNNGN